MGAVGAPLRHAGQAVSLAGAVTKLSAIGLQSRMDKSVLEKLAKSLTNDIFLSERLKIFLSRAAFDEAFCQELQINQHDAVYYSEIIPRMPTQGFITSKRIIEMFPVDKHIDSSSKPPIHIIGLLSGASALPVAQMYINCKIIRSKQPATIFNELDTVMKHMYNELKLYFIGGEFFKLVFTSDGFWAYIAVRATKVDRFLKDQGEININEKDLGQLGFVVFQGRGRKVPDAVKRRVGSEWNSKHAELLAEIEEEDDLEDC